MAAKHEIKRTFTNDYGNKVEECSCGETFPIGGFENHLLTQHRNDVAAQARANALAAAKTWNGSK